jgi:hypothetical protein
MTEPVELKISPEIIRPIIQAKINAAIVEMFEGHERLVSDMISMWMNQKVDSDGKVGNYNSNLPRYEQLIHRMLEDAMKKALDNYLSERKEFITQEFMKFFKSKSGSSALASALQQGVCASLKSNWLTSISFRQLGER